MKAEPSISHPPLPLQPFTVEMLDINRGSWKFVEWHGQHLKLPHAMTAYAYPPRDAKSVQISYLCCDPEYPREHAHAEMRHAVAVSGEADTGRYRINEPFFSCDIKTDRSGAGVLECQLSAIMLGPATTGDRYVEALYVVSDGRYYPVWLAPVGGDSVPPVRLLTNRVGHIFTDKEDVRITLAGLGNDVERELALSLELTDYTTKKSVWSKALKFRVKAGLVSLQGLSIPMKQLGIFELNVVCEAKTIRTLRVCRIPTARKITPDASSIGINLFQQQIWWYAFQAPMMAAAGVRWIRPWLAWENTWNTQQPQPDQWDTRALDASVRRMERFGMRYQDILFQAPKWVSSDIGWGVPPPDRMKEWGEYVYRLVSRYKGKIRDYEVWNEPDGMWTSEPNSAEHYMELLKTTWAAAKKADPHCTIYGFSLAANIDWLKKVCDLGAADYMDIATFHTYASPQEMTTDAQKRVNVLKKYGINRYWINELGAPAYDFDARYSAQFDCSELKQATTIVKNYAQAMALNPDMKVFCFCTYDPRNPAYEPEWTGDAGIGIVYLGFLPKLAYAALAGYARMTDGKRCKGRVSYPNTGLYQVSFEAPVAFVWREGGQLTDLVPAGELGCLADEQITVRDMYTNIISTGKAGQIMLDFAHGPLYIEGSHQMVGLAAANNAFYVQPDELAIDASRTVELEVNLPSQYPLSMVSHPRGAFTLRELSKSAQSRSYSVEAKAATDRVNGVIEVSSEIPAADYGLAQAITMTRKVPVTANGSPNLVRDGSFSRSDLSSWSVSGKSECSLDTSQYHLLPASLKLTAPFEKRLVQWDVKPDPDKPMHLKFWVMTQGLASCNINLSIAWFGPKDWIRTTCLAATELEGVSRIPSNTVGWEAIDAVLNPPYMPLEANRGAFFIDAANGGSGVIWLDDLDMWQ
ncbi:MAG: hypothetical protein ACYC1M_06170 [Armatimonadota bacterium]